MLVYHLQSKNRVIKISNDYRVIVEYLNIECMNNNTGVRQIFFMDGDYMLMKYVDCDDDEWAAYEGDAIEIAHKVFPTNTH